MPPADHSGFGADLKNRLRIPGPWLLPLHAFGEVLPYKENRMLLDENKPLPVDLTGQLLYYVGPSPAKPDQVIGAAGPTTSYRMDLYTPRLLAQGLKATMGKGARSKEVREAMRETGAVYLASIGGAGAYLSKCVTSCELVAFADAGPEALFRFEVANFPAVVINDVKGGDYYEMVKQQKKGA